jgi:hypothetical protein
MLKKNLVAAATFVMGLSVSSVALAETQITWWHAMGGALGDAVNEIAAELQRKSQSEFKITPVFKGTYEETLTAGIAAFRAGEQPNIMQVFDAGAATVIGAKGATVPVQDLLGRATASISTSKTTLQACVTSMPTQRQDDRHAVQLVDADHVLQRRSLSKRPVSPRPRPGKSSRKRSPLRHSRKPVTSRWHSRTCHGSSPRTSSRVTTCLSPPMTMATAMAKPRSWSITSLKSRPCSPP